MATIVFKDGEVKKTSLNYLDVMAVVRENQLIGRGFVLIELLVPNDDNTGTVGRMAYININEIKEFYD